MLGNTCISCVCYRLLTFFSKLTFSKTVFRKTVSVSNGLDLDQDRHFVSPDLGPNCLQRLSADNKSRSLNKESVKDKTVTLIQQK